jgi:hypothetical protein
MRKVSRVRVSRAKKLEERVKELEGKLADSVPKAELQRRLSGSVSKATLDATKEDLKTKITGLEVKLRESVPKSQAEALRGKVKELPAGRRSLPHNDLSDPASRLSEAWA